MGEKVIVVVAALLASLPPPSFTFSIEQHKPQNASTVDIHERKYTVPVYQPSVNSKAEESLINQQSENVRHIIAAEQRNHEQREKQQEEFKQVKKEKSIVSLEDDRFPTLEELRLKCQHFSRLFGLNPSDNIFMENTASDNIERSISSTVVPPRMTEIARRPVFIRNKPAFLQRNNEGFYVTASPLGTETSTTKRPPWIISSTSYPKVVHEYTPKSTTQAPSTSNTRTTTPYVTTTKTADFSDTTSPTTTVRPKIRIKYTKFEPVILQKTILTDGRVMYHWHKSLPTTPVDILAPAAPLATPIVQSPTYEYAPVPGPMPVASHRYLGPAELSTLESSTSSSTTTEKSSWLFVPFSSLFGGSQEEETTMAEIKTSTPSTTTTTAAPPEQNINTKTNPPHSTTEGTKPAQLKVVVPVHYDNIDASLAPPNDNRLEYYRKPVEDSPYSVPVMRPPGVPQSVPRYTLGYTGTGYGLTFNGMPYGGSYGPHYMNYQATVPLQREIEKLDDVAV